MRFGAHLRAVPYVCARMQKYTDSQLSNHVPSILVCPRTLGTWLESCESIYFRILAQANKSCLMWNFNSEVETREVDIVDRSKHQTVLYWCFVIGILVCCMNNTLKMRNMVEWMGSCVFQPFTSGNIRPRGVKTGPSQTQTLLLQNSLRAA